MRLWLIIAMFGIFTVTIVMYFTAGPIPVQSPAISIDVAYIMNPLQYPIPVSVLLVLSLLSLQIEVPQFKRLQPNTAWGVRGIVGLLLWFFLSIGVGLTTVYIGAVYLAEFFWIFWLSGITVQGTMFISSIILLKPRGNPRTTRSSSDTPIYKFLHRAIAKYLRYVPLIVLTSILNTYLLEWLHNDTFVPGTLRMLASADSTLKWILLMILIILIAPVCEEWFFRGVLYRLCREWSSEVPSALISGFLFSMVHREPIWFLPVLVLGYILAREYERTGSLWVPVSIHATQNALSFALLFFVME